MNWKMFTPLTFFLAFAMLNQSALASPPRQIPLGRFSRVCREAIVSIQNELNQNIPAERHRPFITWVDAKGNFAISLYAHDTLLRGSRQRELEAIQFVAEQCPNVAMILVSANMGAGQRWYKARTNFQVPHYRDSGRPADRQFYWGWSTVPFNYDPLVP